MPGRPTISLRAGFHRQLLDHAEAQNVSAASIVDAVVNRALDVELAPDADWSDRVQPLTRQLREALVATDAGTLPWYRLRDSVVALVNAAAPPGTRPIAAGPPATLRRLRCAR